MRRGAGVGHVLAPWPFLVFSFIALAVGALACPSLGTARGVMVAFDAAALAFLIPYGPETGLSRLSTDSGLGTVAHVKHHRLLSDLVR